MTLARSLAVLPRERPAQEGPLAAVYSCLFQVLLHHNLQSEFVLLSLISISFTHARQLVCLAWVKDGEGFILAGSRQLCCQRCADVSAATPCVTVRGCWHEKGRHHVLILHDPRKIDEVQRIQTITFLISLFKYYSDYYHVAHLL